jgi:hypothetical protein
MSEVFNIKRFLLLFKKIIAERPTQTLGVTALLLVLSFFLYVTIKKIFGVGPAQNLTFIWGLAGGGFFLSSFMFGYFNTNASGSSYLTLPASFLEKWLCGILMTGILYPLIFLIFFHALDALSVTAYHNSLDKASLFYKQQYESVYNFDLNGMIAWKVYSLFLQLTGIMLTGSLYFNKIPLIKTGLSVCVIVIAIFGLNWLLANMFFSNISDAGPYDHVTLSVGNERASLILPTELDSFFHISIAFVIPVVLWFLPLLRLREKEF